AAAARVDVIFVQCIVRPDDRSTAGGGDARCNPHHASSGTFFRRIGQRRIIRGDQLCDGTHRSLFSSEGDRVCARQDRRRNGVCSATAAGDGFVGLSSL